MDREPPSGEHLRCTPRAKSLRPDVSLWTCTDLADREVSRQEQRIAGEPQFVTFNLDNDRMASQALVIGLRHALDSVSRPASSEGQAASKLVHAWLWAVSQPNVQKFEGFALACLRLTLFEVSFS
ncbi:MAG: hypothetical protein ACOC6F_03620 [bacterium]